jgi:hypothetical protein
MLRFHILMVLCMKKAFSWDVALCSPVYTNQHFRKLTASIIRVVTLESGSSSAVLVNTYHTAQCNIPEDCHFLDTNVRETFFCHLLAWTLVSTYKSTQHYYQEGQQWHSTTEYICHSYYLELEWRRRMTVGEQPARLMKERYMSVREQNFVRPTMNLLI